MFRGVQTKMARIARIYICFLCLALISPILAASAVQTKPDLKIPTAGLSKSGHSKNVSFKVNPAMQAIAAESSTGSSFMPGLPSTHKTLTTPRASVKLQTPFHGTKKLRNLLKINGKDSTSLFLRFDLDNFGANAPDSKKRLFGENANKERVHYGPSIGFQVTVSPKLNVEAEYSPQFGASGNNIGPAKAKFSLKDSLNRIERVDEFRLRINLNFGSAR